jgi:hypothetical protein
VGVQLKRPNINCGFDRTLETSLRSKDNELGTGIVSMLALGLLEQLLHGFAEGGVQCLYVLGSDLAALLLLHCDGRTNLRKRAEYR